MTNIMDAGIDRAPSIMGRASGWRWFRSPWRRRGVFAVLVIACCFLTIFPRFYEARVLLAPQDSLVSGSILSPTPFDGGSEILPGLPQPVDIELAIARSMDVSHSVQQSMGGDAPAEIRAIRAGIIEITVRDRDEGRALKAAALYAKAVQAKLARLREEQITLRRTQLSARFAESGLAAERADAALAKAPNDRQRMADRDAARALHNGYRRALDSAARDEQTADIRLTMLDPPAIDAGKRYNPAAAALLLALLLIAAASEFYMARPPRGVRPI